jgi:hypothetical protein
MSYEFSATLIFAWFTVTVTGLMITDRLNEWVGSIAISLAAMFVSSGAVVKGLKYVV